LPCFYDNSGFGGLPPEAGQRRFINDPQQFMALFEAAATTVTVLPDAAIGVAPHSLRAVTPASLCEVLASVSAGPIHIHAAEQKREVDDCVSWSGQRPVEWLVDHTDIGPRWCIIHATHMLPQETERLARSGAVAGLCPITEANLGDGVFDAVRYITYGGRFALGTDSNILIDAPGEIRQLEYSQRLKSQSRNVLASGYEISTGRFLYERAASGGAQAAGRKVGALREGLRADFVVLNPDHPDLGASSGDRWLDAYIFTAAGNALDSVVCGGKLVVQNGVHFRREQIAAQYKRSLRKLVDV
jgi:formimidoylglutamate deiminase